MYINECDMQYCILQFLGVKQQSLAGYYGDNRLDLKK
jgi:hypothetical protein